MELGKNIANRFREVLLSGNWIAATNVKNQISDLTWEQATTKIETLNTIAALTFHINYYIAGLVHVFEGGELAIRDKYSFDLPPVTSQKDWQQLIGTVLSKAEKFATIVENMTNEKLYSDFVDKKYGNYQRNIEGIIEHSYYHLGQITLIKKMVLKTETKKQ